MIIFGLKISICRIHKRIKCRASNNISEIPLVWQNEIPFITCTVNGCVASMMVDTGANVTVICEPSISKLGLSAGDDSRVHYERGNIRKSNVLGRYKIVIADGIEVISAPILSGTKAPNFEYDGILSNSILRDLKAVIDYGSNVLRIVTPVS